MKSKKKEEARKKPDPRSITRRKFNHFVSLTCLAQEKIFSKEEARKLRLGKAAEEEPSERLKVSAFCEKCKKT